MLSKKTFLPLLFFVVLSFSGWAQFDNTIFLFTDNSWKARKEPVLPGWTGLTYDDSSWPNAMVVSQQQCLDPFGQTPVLPSLPIWSKRISCSNPPDAIILRKIFTIYSLCEPGGNVGYNICIKADDTSEVYINGCYIGTTVNRWMVQECFDIPKDCINVWPGSNIIAVRATDAGTTGWFSAVLRRICP